MERFAGRGKKFMNFRTEKNYWQQDISRNEYVLMLVKSVGILAVTAWTYYRSIWAFMLLSPVGIWYFQRLRRERIRQKSQDFILQFREMMQTFSSLLNTGYSIENALKESLTEMYLLYPKDAAIIRELEIMVRQLKMQIPAEQVITELADRTKLADVESFAEVFVTAKRSGGDMMGIIRNTVNQISDKIDVRREIDTLLAAKKYEFKVMSVIPFGIIAYMSASFPEFMRYLYGNVIGIGVMTICFMIYIAAYWLGLKVIEIEV